MNVYTLPIFLKDKNEVLIFQKYIFFRIQIFKHIH